MPRYVTGICKNCGVCFEGIVIKGVLPKFHNRDCHYAYTRRPSQIKKRFWRFVQKGEPHECWLWIGNLYTGGYGRFSYARESKKYKLVRAHRFAWTIMRGRIPKGMFVCHKCDTPLCCNPDHLFLGWQKDNMLDKVQKNRQTKGESYGSAKLTEKDVKNILRLRRRGYFYEDIAETYKISKSAVSAICRGKLWKHVERL